MPVLTVSTGDYLVYIEQFYGGDDSEMITVYSDQIPLLIARLNEAAAEIALLECNSVQKMVVQ